MKWFKEGLTKEELKSEYRKLAREWHPDVNKSPEATDNMKQINDEFDRYFVAAAKSESGYDRDDIINRYKKAREERSTILAYMRKDKYAENEGKNQYFAFNKYGKIITEGPSWDGFRGGFALCRLTQQIEETAFFHSLFFYSSTKEVKDQKIEKLPATFETPTYADMYFALHYAGFETQSTAIATTDIKAAKMAEGKYTLINTGRFKFWINKEVIYRSYGSFFWGIPDVQKSITWAYLKVNGQIMRCPFNMNKDYYKEIESVYSNDFGYKIFQDCTAQEFVRWHTYETGPAFSQGLEMEEIKRSDDFWWIENPMIRYFAKKGVVRFYQSKRKYQLRYGTFTTMTDEYLSELSIDDAEEIQDFLDKLNKSYEDSVKGMIKKGKLKIDIGDTYGHRLWF